MTADEQAYHDDAFTIESKVENRSKSLKSTGPEARVIGREVPWIVLDSLQCGIELGLKFVAQADQDPLEPVNAIK